MSGNFLLLRINKVFGFYAEILTETDNIDTFSMLRNTEIHGVDNLRRNNGVTDLIESIKDCFKSLSFVVNGKTFHIFKEESFRLFATKNFCNIKEQCTSGLFKTEAFTGK